MRLAQFHHSLTRLEQRDDLLKRFTKRIEEGGLPAIGYSQPDELDLLIGTQNKCEVVLVLAHDDARLGSRKIANDRVVRLRERNVEDVDGVVAFRGQPARERCGQLVIDQKPHVVWRTA